MSRARPRAALQALRELLFDPRTFVAERDVARSFGAAAAVACAVALVATAAVGAFGFALSQQIDATRTETVVEPWSESQCEGFADTSVSVTPEQCAIDEPVTRAVDVGAELWHAFAGRLPLVFGGVLVGWALTAAALHAVSSFVNGAGRFGRTATVVGWAMLPSLVQTAVGLGSLLLLVQGQSFGGDPELLRQQFQRLQGGVTNGWTVLATVVSVAWQAYIWAGGLPWARDLSGEDAWGVAAVVGLVSLALSLV